MFLYANEITLFQIPVYLPRNTFNKSCITNQVIGMIDVTYGNEKIHFHVFKITENKLCSTFNMGDSFMLWDSITNNSLIKEIKIWLNSLKEYWKFPKYSQLDLSLFNNIVNYLDLKKLIAEKDLLSIYEYIDQKKSKNIHSKFEK